MKLVKRLFAHFEEYYAYERMAYLRYAGAVGAICYPLFYLVYIYLVPHPYENLTIRLIAAALCLPLACLDRWPSAWKRFCLPWAYLTIFYCLPFFHVFMTLKNQGGIVLVVDSMMAVFFLVLLTDWRNTVAMLALGIGLGSLFYLCTTPDHTMPMDYVGRLPTVMLVVVGGSLFKFSEKKVMDKQRLTAALAGSIAHEMRNPLGQIKYSLDRIEQSLPAPGAAYRDVSIAPESLGRLYRQLSEGQRAIERGLQVIAMTLDEVSAKEIDAANFRYLHAGQTTRKAVEEFNYETEGMRDRVSLSVVNDFVFRGDETAYVFLLFNLIKNALYYCRQHTGLSVDILIDSPCVSVTDNGPGIADDMRQKLFDPFATSGKRGGTGLGLSYCKRAMQAFGGAIRCESRVGEFTSFILSFPELDHREFDLQQHLAGEQARGVLAGKHILVVDDEALMRQHTLHMLDGMGMLIEQAASGAAAIEYLRNRTCDLIIMDINLPGEDGCATAERIRSGAVPGRECLPILAYSSEPEDVLRVMSGRSGMNAHLAKPCSREDLLAAVIRTFDQASLHASHEKMAADLSGKCVLLAEDNPFNRLIVGGYLEQWQLKVLTASHGAEVLAHLERGCAVDAVLMDLHMPGMDGIETTIKLRNADAPWRKVPVIALTGESTEDAIGRAYAAGMNDFITKPVDAMNLCAILHRHVGGTGVDR
jgi:CheY-like chemotaxis protein/signal transduction histidine kinase